MCCLPGEHLAPGCTTGRTQVDSMILWAIPCWEFLSPEIHVNVTMTHITYLSIVQDRVHPLIETVVPDGWASFSRIMYTATKQKCLGAQQ